MQMNFIVCSNISFTDSFYDFFRNPVVITALFAWFFAAVAKAFVALISTGQISLENFIGTGGMPSTHTSPVAAIALMIGLIEGFDSSVFGVALLLMVVVMYDASGVRRAAGRHARMINILVKSLFEGEQMDQTQLVELRELLGHEPIEVAGGAAIGFLTTFYFYSSGIFG